MAKPDNPQYLDDKSMSLPDAKNKIDDVFLGNSIIDLVEGRFTRAKEARRYDEERWLRAYRNYRGIYGNDVKFTDAEKSRVFIKVTKTKVLAAYGQITDVLFANNTFPLSVEPTQVPEGVAEHVHIETNPQLKEGAGAPDMAACLVSKVTVKTCLPVQPHSRCWIVSVPLAEMLQNEDCQRRSLV
jgi:hypothetical protein